MFASLWRVKTFSGLCERGVARCWGSNSSDDSSLLWCYDESVDAYCLTFHGIVLPLKFGTAHPGTWCHIPQYLNHSSWDMVSHPTIPEPLILGHGVTSHNTWTTHPGTWCHIPQYLNPHYWESCRSHQMCTVELKYWFVFHDFFKLY